MIREFFEIVLAQRNEANKVDTHTAMRMFTEAASTYPTSLTAQGLFIALRCKEKGIDPAHFQDQSAWDTQSISQLQRAADIRHQQSKQGPKDQHGRITKVNPKTMLGLLTSAFHRAGVYMPIRTDAIDRLLAEHVEMVGQYGLSVDLDLKLAQDADNVLDLVDP